MWGAACRVQLNVPLKCTPTTASKSDSSILSSVLSRMMPALFTRMSTLPNESSAVCTMLAAPANSLTESKLGTATPPSASISLHTSTAGRSSVASPDRLAPTSFTTTLAPSAARHLANSRPMPRPDPVTMATRSSSSMRRSLKGSCQRSAVDLVHARERQGVDDAHLFGKLVGGQSRRRELAEVLERRSCPAAGRNHECDADLAHDPVRPGHHGDG